MRVGRLRIICSLDVALFPSRQVTSDGVILSITSAAQSPIECPNSGSPSIEYCSPTDLDLYQDEYYEERMPYPRRINSEEGIQLCSMIACIMAISSEKRLLVMANLFLMMRGNDFCTAVGTSCHRCLLVLDDPGYWWYFRHQIDFVLFGHTILILPQETHCRFVS